MDLLTNRLRLEVLLEVEAEGLAYHDEAVEGQDADVPHFRAQARLHEGRIWFFGEDGQRMEEGLPEERGKGYGRRDEESPWANDEGAVVV